MPPVRFRSRIDLWLPLVTIGPIAWAMWMVVSRSGEMAGTETGNALMISVLAMMVSLAFVIWLLLDTSYTVTETELLVRSGPVRRRVPLASIRSVKRTASLLSAPALSLRRLEVQYDAHDAHDAVIISPADIEGFVTALTARNPAIQRLAGV